MDIPLDNPLRLLSHLLLFLLNFLDDAVLLGLSRIGLDLPWLQWISSLMLGYTVLVWTLRLLNIQVWKISCPD